MSAQRRPAAGGSARDEARLTDALHAGARYGARDDARLGEIVGGMSSADYDAELLALAGAIEGAALDPDARDVQGPAADRGWWRRLLATLGRAAGRLAG